MTKANTRTKARTKGTVGAAWRSRKGLFALVASADAEQLTGRSFDELRELPGVQVMRRIYADGSQEEALRVPRELLVATAREER